MATTVPTMTKHSVLTINQAQVIIDGKNYGDAVSSVTLVPTATQQEWKAVSGNNQSLSGRASWAANVTLGQDYNTAALFRYLYDNEGKRDVSLEVMPAGGAGPSFKGTIGSLPAPQVGGAADSVATADVVLGLTGKPAVTWGA